MYKCTFTCHPLMSIVIKIWCHSFSYSLSPLLVSFCSQARNLTLFSFHPVCMSIGTLIFLAEGIVTYRNKKLAEVCAFLISVYACDFKACIVIDLIYSISYIPFFNYCINMNASKS